MTLFIIGFYFPLFYLQLDAISHGLNKKFAFYSVESLEYIRFSFLNALQLVIMNFSSFIGRLSPALYANSLGVDNAVIISTGCCSILILGMIGVKSVTGVVVFGVIYGFFSGICKISFQFICMILLRVFRIANYSFSQTSRRCILYWPF